MMKNDRKMTKKKYYIFAIVVSIIAVPFICYYYQPIKNMLNDSVSFREHEYEYDSEVLRARLLYPQITGSEDEEKEERINQLIEDDIKKMVDKDMLPHEDGYVFDIGVGRYEIKYMDEKLLSIAYYGRAGYRVPARGYPTTMWATTIDIENEKVLELHDVVGNFDGLYEQLRNNRFEHITEWDGKAGEYQISTDYYDDAELKEALLNGDMEWYIEGENFVIVSLEGQGAGVGHNEYARNVKYLRQILKEDFLKKLE